MPSCVCRPAEIEKLQMLAQDPRPMQEKQAVLAQVSINQHLAMHSWQYSLKASGHFVIQANSSTHSFDYI